MEVMTQTDGASARDTGRKREQCSKRDDSVDKVKLEIKPTDGGAKNVTCQVACGNSGQERRICTVGDKKQGRVGMTDA